MNPLHVRADGSFVVLLDRLPYHVTLDDPLWPQAAALDWSQAKPERPVIETAAEEKIVAVNKLDAAVEQIEWAISLLIDHDAFLPAITLAGAAEEIFGKRSGRPILNQMANLADTMRAGQGKQFIIIFNEIRNWLKHHNTENNEPWMMDFDPRTAAVFMVDRALANHSACGLPPLKNAHRYHVWLYESGGASMRFKTAGGEKIKTAGGEKSKP